MALEGVYGMLGTCWGWFHGVGRTEESWRVGVVKTCEPIASGGLESCWIGLGWGV